MCGKLSDPWLKHNQNCFVVGDYDSFDLNMSVNKILPVWNRDVNDRGDDVNDDYDM